MLPSFKRMTGTDFKKLSSEGLVPAGYFYKELYDLYQYVIDTKKETNPIVICADDLQVGWVLTLFITLSLHLAINQGKAGAINHKACASAQRPQGTQTLL